MKAAEGMVLEELHARLRGLRRFVRLVILGRGLGLWLILTAAGLLTALALDYLMVLPSVTRMALLALGLAGSGYYAWRWVIAPLRVPLSEEDMAILVERRYPDLREELISAVEFSDPDRTGKSQGSQVMMRAVVEEALKRVTGRDFRAGIETRQARWASAGALCAAAAVTMLLLMSSDARIAATRFFNPYTSRTWPPVTVVSHESPEGDSVVARGDTLPVEIGFGGRVPARVRLRYRFSGGKWQEDRMSPTPGARGEFGHVFGKVGDDLEYRVQGGVATGTTHRVTVVERIRIRDKTITYLYRPYTRLGDAQRRQVMEGAGGAVRAPEGTDVLILAVTNKPVKRFETVLFGRTGDGFTQTNETTLQGKLRLSMPQRGEPQTYTIRLWDQHGFPCMPEETYGVQVEPDMPPVVRFEEPTQKTKVVTAQGKVPLEVVFQDQYGLQDGALEFLVREGTEGKELPGSMELFRAEEEFGQKSETVRTEWDLAGLNLAEGMTVRYRARGRDFCDVPEPRLGYSEYYVLRVVGVEEFVAEVRRRQNELVVGELERVMELQERNLSQTAELEALARSGELTSEQKGRLLGLELAQRQVSSRAGQVRESAAALVRELNNNRLAETPTARQLDSAVRELEDMAAGTMPGAENALKEARASESRDQAQSLKTAREAQSRVREGLDRMLAELRQWQGLAELLARARVVLKRQQILDTDTLSSYRLMLADGGDQTARTALGDHAREQGAIKTDLGRLMEDMVTSAGKLAESVPVVSRKVRSAYDEAVRTDIAGQMDRVVEQLGKGLVGATDSQARVEEDLKTLVENLSDVPREERNLEELKRKYEDLARRLEGVLEQEKSLHAQAGGATALERMLQGIEKAQAEVREMKGEQSRISGATPGSGEPGKPGQDELGKQQGGLAQKAGKTAEAVEGVKKDAPAGAGQTKPALDEAQGQLSEAKANMEKAASGVGQGRKKEAGQAQGEASKNLAEAEKSLESAREGAKRELDRLAGELARRQEETRRETERLSREMEQMRRETAGRTGEAAGHMQEAQNKLGGASGQQQPQGKQEQTGQGAQGGQKTGQSPPKSEQMNAEKARQEMQRAIEKLQEARGEVGERQEEFAMMEREQELLVVETALREMLKTQLGVNDTTTRVEGSRGPNQALSRRDKLELSKITRDEAGLVRQSEGLKKALEEGGVPVYAWVMEQVGGGMTQVRDRLRAEDTGAETARLEREVAGSLEDLIKGLQEERRQSAGQKKSSSAGMKKAAQKRLVPALAELKMVRVMHDRLSRETADLDRLTDQNKVSETEAREAAGRISDREAQIGRLLQGLLDALQEEPLEEPLEE